SSKARSSSSRTPSSPACRSTYGTDRSAKAFALLRSSEREGFSRASEGDPQAEVHRPVVVLLLEHAIGDALVVAEQRVVQVERIEAEPRVARDLLRDRQMERAVGVVEAILGRAGADHVDVRAVEVDRDAAGEAGLLVRRRDVADVA